MTTSFIPFSIMSDCFPDVQTNALLFHIHTGMHAHTYTYTHRHTGAHTYKHA